MQHLLENLVLLEKGSALEKQAFKDNSVTLKYFGNAVPMGVYVTQDDYAKCLTKLKPS